MVGDFDQVVASLPNDQLRGQLSSFFLQNMPANPKSGDRDRVIWSAIREYPEFIDYYIRYKEDNGDKAKDVSQEKVAETENLFIRNVNELIELLDKTKQFYSISIKTYQEDFARVMLLKDVIENKDGYKVFYDGDIPLRREVDLQLFFRLTWFASISDVNREVDNGHEPVEHKISYGGKGSTLVEFKLASNSQLKRNLERQVEIHEKVSKSTNPSIKVILYFSEAELNKTKSILEELKLQNNKNIVLIDARKDNKHPDSSLHENYNQLTPSKELRQKIEQLFSLNELHTICFDLGFDHEKIGISNKDGFVREMLLAFHRQNKLEELIAECKRLRPHVDWGL